MNSQRMPQMIRIVVVLAMIFFCLALRVQAQTESSLYTFGPEPDGQTPSGGLIFDSAGNLYGTTVDGGINCPNFGCGTVFQLVPGSGGWTENILYRFTGGTDGKNPQSSLIIDAAGNLYGTTFGGGNTSCTVVGSGCGVVFKLSPRSGGTWTESVLYSFIGGRDGAGPLGALVFDGAGNLYGTTSQGGNSFGFQSAGGVFQLVPNSSGGWTENSIYTFHGIDGAQSAATLVFDSAGNLYGTTQEGGGGTACSTSGCGVVFKLTPTSSGPWTEKVIHHFNIQNGANPYAGVTFDSAGNLYGTTLDGGIAALCLKGGCGTVFELSPNSTGGWQQTRIFKFHETDGWNPYAGVIVDASGNVYGTTLFGGDLTTCGNKDGCGVAYELTPGASGWTRTLLHVFGTTATDGDRSFGGLTFDSSGNLYGTTQYGGDLVSVSPFGIVYEITP